MSGLIILWAYVWQRNSFHDNCKCPLSNRLWVSPCQYSTYDVSTYSIVLKFITSYINVIIDWFVPEPSKQHRPLFGKEIYVRSCMPLLRIFLCWMGVYSLTFVLSHNAKSHHAVALPNWLFYCFSIILVLIRNASLKYVRRMSWYCQILLISFLYSTQLPFAI